MIPFWKKNKDGGKKKPPKADMSIPFAANFILAYQISAANPT